MIWGYHCFRNHPYVVLSYDENTLREILGKIIFAPGPHLLKNFLLFQPAIFSCKRFFSREDTTLEKIRGWGPAQPGRCYNEIFMYRIMHYLCLYPIIVCGVCIYMIDIPSWELTHPVKMQL